MSRKNKFQIKSFLNRPKKAGLAVLACIMIIALSIGIGVIVKAVTGTADTIYTTVGGTWEQVDENTWTMDTDDDGEANITLVKDGDEWKYYFEVDDPTAEYYAWENSIPDGYKMESDYNGYYHVPVGSEDLGGEGYYAIISGNKDAVITNKTDDVVTYGGLKLTKNVSGSSDDLLTTNFRFDITLSSDDENLAKYLEGSQNFGDVTFKDGVGLVYLKAGQSVTVSDVPAGINWKVTEENSAGYTVTWSGDGEATAGGREGTIEENNIMAVECTNTKTSTTPEPEPPETGTLSVLKTVENGEASDEFTFHAVFWGLKPGSTYEYQMLDDSAGVTKYSHTPNINDEGVQDGNYANNFSSNDVVTIPGAKSLNITITYQTESTSYDWVCMWEGNHPTYTAKANWSSSKTGKLGGAKTSKSYSVEGDTVTFGFQSDGSVNNYGYYAVITADQIVNSFTANAAGIADVEFSLKDGESIAFDGLPIGCNYQVMEESSDYTASYQIEGAVTAVSPSGENYVSGQSLTTAKETLDSGEAATVRFTNRKPQVDEDFLSIPVQKIWSDNDNASGARPDYITVYLLQNDNVVASARLDEDNEWSTVFDHLEKYQEDGETLYEYDVQEIQVPGYSSLITQEDDGSYTITNTSEDSGSLKVSKSVIGDALDLSKEFKFTVSLKDSNGDPVTGTYALDSSAGSKTGTIVFDEEGKAAFTLKDQESIVISNLPAGTEYSVKETSYSGYIASGDGVCSGVIKTDETSEAAVTNTRCYALTVSKTVEGNMGDKTKDFRFVLKLSGDTVPESLTYMKGNEKETVSLENGTVEFTLAHDETIIFAEIPYGISYEVEELDGKSSGYKVEADGKETASVSGELQSDKNIEFINTKDGTVPTSADTNTRILIILAVFAAAGAACVVYRRRKKVNG